VLNCVKYPLTLRSPPVFLYLYLSVGNIKSLPNVWKMRLFQVPTSPLERHDTCGTVRLKGDKVELAELLLG
jgi:hypothetical protein